MSRPRSKHRPLPVASARRGRASFGRQLRIVIAATLLFGAIGAIVVNWEHLFPVDAERSVTVYRTHGCRCALTWADSLKAEGFVVRMFEYETLQYVRHSLHTPATLHGCHVASYLDYFVEGHVSPAALRELAAQRPTGLGLTTEASMLSKDAHLSIERDESSRVLFIAQDGHTVHWFRPTHNPNG